ncbi:MAG: glycosyltransferase [Ruminococcaceae bacterium]|nr:glycosyltransferase [Oscillospiraceae bacterium]
MSIFDKVTVVIPSYKPDEKLISTLNGVIDTGFTDIIVVDDGGGEKYAPIFEKVKAMPGCTVLHHPVNRGKGAALKTAFAYYLENRPESVGLVTADADGQHLPEDILGCARDMAEKESVILGVRDFSLPHVPPRSKAGNRFTSGFFKIFFGMNISDTQTGLRAIPRKYLKPIAEVEGDRYEYETHMLFLIGKAHIPMAEHTIDTVYIDDNSSSHFRVVRDSARIYKMVLLFAFSSLVCTVIDIVLDLTLATIVSDILQVSNVFATALLAFAGARLISAVINYFLNRFAVFKDGGRISFPRYVLLACSIFAVNIIPILIVFVFPIPFTNAIVMPLRLIVSLMVFPVSFKLQHNFVFNKYKCIK